MRGRDVWLCFSENKAGKVWMDYVQQIMNEEINLDHKVECDAVRGPVVCVS